ncbi:COG3014 family protein [Oligoflexus tunisiensis]|uniref:COG3014 family protein n=1 Tax=Oligoflexus tunisiensis TaxID=708132 RepID=UPI00114CED6B|nr:hypothetical protein [Oligoflexus tunisiensis]
MIKFLRHSGLVSGLVFFLTGCASYSDDIRQVQTSFRAGQYGEALQKLEESPLKEQTRNRLLYLLEKAMILDRQGQREDSRKLLLKADRIVDELYTTSVSKAAATFVFNDSAQDYPGEDYEKVAIHTMLAHSFIEDGDLKAARVEAARINTRLNEINSFYEENKNRYKEDAYARYLAGMIYEALGEDDSAIVDYRAALKIYEGDYRKIFATQAPDHLVVALYRLLVKRRRADEAKELKKNYELQGLDTRDSLGEVVVLHELGEIASKEKSEFVIPIGSEIVRFSFPVIRRVKAHYGRTGIRIDDDRSQPADLAQNFDMIARETLEDRRGRIVAKSLARLVMKSQMTQKAQKEFGAIGWLAGNIYGAVTETADTRSWALLPAAVQVSRILLKPGNYDLTIFNDGKTSRVRKVSIKAGELQLIRDY